MCSCSRIRRTQAAMSSAAKTGADVTTAPGRATTDTGKLHQDVCLACSGMGAAPLEGDRDLGVRQFDHPRLHRLPRRPRRWPGSCTRRSRPRRVAGEDDCVGPSKGAASGRHWRVTGSAFDRPGPAFGCTTASDCLRFGGCGAAGPGHKQGGATIPRHEGPTAVVDELAGSFACLIILQKTRQPPVATVGTAVPPSVLAAGGSP